VSPETARGGGRHVIVVGAGISGLAAAWALHRRPGTTVTVLDAAAMVGGKARVSAVDGIGVDEGAETFLARTGEVAGLAAEVGLAEALTVPETTSAALAVAGSLRPLPARTVMGVPADLDALAAGGVLGPAALARVRAEPDEPGEPITGDVAIGGLVRRRLGDEVADRLVDPLLGGVYAGRSDELSLAAAVPALAARLAEQGSLVIAARQVLAAGSARPGGPEPAGAVFGGIRGGVGRLPTAVAAALEKAGVTIRLGTAVRELHRTGAGWRLVAGPARRPEVLIADGVVLAVPAPAAARLLREVAPSAAAELGDIRYASMALITLVLPAPAWTSTSLTLPPGSGLLVPATEGYAVKAATWASAKWSWVAAAAGGRRVLRVSVGRYGEELALHRTDDELVRLVLDELRRLVRPAGHDVSAPVAWRVTRWGGALPQYAVGHLDRVRRTTAALEGLPALALAGAAYQGVGLPACIRSGYLAAATVSAGLVENGSCEQPERAADQ
jgi:oxygen-dependent protoporphyrinogen oxidase